MLLGGIYGKSDLPTPCLHAYKFAYTGCHGAPETAELHECQLPCRGSELRTNGVGSRERLLSRLGRPRGGQFYQSRRGLLGARLEADESGHHWQAARSG